MAKTASPAGQRPRPLKPPNRERDVPGNPKFAIVILAAGKGTRLKSRHPKVLHQIGGKPLLEHVVQAAKQLVPAKDVYAVIGHEAERVQHALAATGINFILQAEQRGTGHAIMMARQALVAYDACIVLSGDVPLIRPETIARLQDSHGRNGAAMTILTAEAEEPTGYGRILRQKKGGKITDVVTAIVEQKSATPQQLKIREFNSGIYAFSTRPLFAHLDELTTDNPHREFYLTDMAAILRRAGEPVVALRCEDAKAEVMGVNTRADLARLDVLMRMRKAKELMAEGVTIYRPETCVIDAEVRVAPDTILEPYVQLLGHTQVGSDCHIGSYCVITDSTLGNNLTVLPLCVMNEAHVADDAIVGPYSRLRPGAEVGEGAHVGNFVELKKTRLGKGSKANHLTYLGDATIGEHVNIGAGTITCNYDGVHKHPTTIEDGVFVGSDAILVAPVRVGRGAYVAAASCITEDVPDDSLALGRARQSNKIGWAKQKRERQDAAGK